MSKKYNPYKVNPKLRAKKNKNQRAYNKKHKARDQPKAVARNRMRRKLGIVGKGGKDVSHTTDGKLVLENASTNRGRNGQNGKSTLKPSAKKKAPKRSPKKKATRSRKKK